MRAPDWITGRAVNCRTGDQLAYTANRNFPLSSFRSRTSIPSRRQGQRSRGEPGVSPSAETVRGARREDCTRRQRSVDGRLCRGSCARRGRGYRSEDLHRRPRRRCLKKTRSRCPRRISELECCNSDKSRTGAYQPLGAVSRLFKILKGQRPRSPLGECQALLGRSAARRRTADSSRSDVSGCLF